MLKKGTDLQQALIEKHAAKQSPSRVDELVAIFIRATKVSTTSAHSSYFP